METELLSNIYVFTTRHNMTVTHLFFLVLLGSKYKSIKKCFPRQDLVFPLKVDLVATPTGSYFLGRQVQFCCTSKSRKQMAFYDHTLHLKVWGQ